MRGATALIESMGCGRWAKQYEGVTPVDGAGYNYPAAFAETRRPQAARWAEAVVRQWVVAMAQGPP